MGHNGALDPTTEDTTRGEIYTPSNGGYYDKAPKGKITVNQERADVNITQL